MYWKPTDSTLNGNLIAANGANDSSATAITAGAVPNTRKRKLLWYPCRRGGKKVRLRNFEYNGYSGPNPKEVPQGIDTRFEFYSLFMTNDILETLVKYTNMYAEQKIVKLICNESSTPNCRLSRWKDVTADELRVFFGIIIWMGLDGKPSFSRYWSNDPLYHNSISQKMSRNRFELILSHLHACDNEAADQTDKLYKLGTILDDLNKLFAKMLIPGSQVCIDETMMSWRGRLSFRQYIPSKRHKYGIKLDVGVYGPLKKCYSAVCDAFMTANPGKVIRIDDVAGLFKSAYEKIATVRNATKGFEATGIQPYNPNIFPDEAFDPAKTTERPDTSTDVQSSDTSLDVSKPSLADKSSSSLNISAISAILSDTSTPSSVVFEYSRYFESVGFK